MPDYRTDRVRLVLLVFRKPGMSLQDFQDHWRIEHAKVVSGIGIMKRNLLKYEQVHSNELFTGKLKALGFDVPDFDGMSVFEAVSYNKILECFTDEEYRRVGIPDEERFVDRGRTIAMPGDLFDVIGPGGSQL